METEKKPRLTRSTLIPLLLLTLLSVTGCEIVNGIFQTGIGVGAFIVIVIVIVIIVIIRRFRR